MVFSTIPIYLDPPNWQQQLNYHQTNGSTDSPLLFPPLPPQPQPPHVGGGAGSIKPGSMADRARLANIAPPEAALKCPRCESTNTKFCYFNNYSLSQPRHFCKTCRRYWTRGGALRNVPVGGGCRRNKKNKSSRSKSPKQSLSNSSIAIPSTELVGQVPEPSNLPFMPSLQNLSRYGMGSIGLNLREIQGQTDHMGFRIASNSSGGGMDLWRLQQFPFLNSFESTSAAVETPSGLVGDGGLENIDTSSRVTQQPPVKLEDSGDPNLSRSPLSMSENNQYYSWTDLSGLPSSSPSHVL